MTRITTLLALALAAAGCENSGHMGPQGGEMHSEDGRLTLSVPEGALAASVDLEIVDPEGALPHGSVGLSYEVRPLGTGFRLPATVTFELEESDIEGFGNLAVICEKEGQWYYMPNITLDREDMTLSASALYATRYAVVAELVE